LAAFPERGRRRDDILPGLRSIGFERRATIAFRVLKTRVEIVSIAYGGRDFESGLRKGKWVWSRGRHPPLADSEGRGAPSQV
jgi:toxin ParE1/3/4